MSEQDREKPERATNDDDNAERGGGDAVTKRMDVDPCRAEYGGIPDDVFVDPSEDTLAGDPTKLGTP